MSCLEASKRKKKIKVELKSKISKFTQEMSNCSILDLPELILHQICTLLSCPFDLINLGSTCQKLYEVTNVPSLWIRLAFNWCEGIWQWIDDVPSAENERTWFINLLHNAAKLPHDAKHHCSLENGEEWIRVDSKRFRSYVGMLQWSYGDRDEYHHPAILFRRWIYDVDNDDNILDIWQEDLDKLKVVLKCKDLIRDCATILRKYDWLDAIVDQIKSRWRQCLQEEIFSVLNISHQEKLIQINLTDSDLIGGDNRRQEMASAAFVSKDGVLVTWQLTGRGRY
ncbi:uncharacterized protein [Centruroides vittatus]|uniref:uncharacterized protein isoform X2 n=1 Tax=Centruroides vittatus TaxID=120091 RepID=UPI00350FB6EC